MGREGARTDTRAWTDKRTDRKTDIPEWVQTPPQVNAECDVVIKLSVFGTDRHTHTHTHKAKLIYILAMHADVTECEHRSLTGGEQSIQKPINCHCRLEKAGVYTLKIIHICQV